MYAHIKSKGYICCMRASIAYKGNETMYVCIYICMHACMYACMYICMYVCMYEQYINYLYLVHEYKYI